MTRSSTSFFDGILSIVGFLSAAATEWDDGAL